MNRDIQNLLLMKEYINKIELYISENTFEDFLGNDLLYDAVCMLLLQIGETGMKLTEGISLQNIDIDEMRGFRNRITHEYIGLNDEIVWDTIDITLPKLKIIIDKILISLN